MVKGDLCRFDYKGDSFDAVYVGKGSDLDRTAYESRFNKPDSTVVVAVINKDRIRWNTLSNHSGHMVIFSADNIV